MTTHLPVLVPLSRDDLEGLAGGSLLSGRINAVDQQQSCLPMALPRLGKPHVWIDSQCESLLLATESVAVTPVPASIRCDEQVQTAAVGEFPRTVCALDAADRGIGKQLLVLLGR